MINPKEAYIASEHESLIDFGLQNRNDYADDCLTLNPKASEYDRCNFFEWYNGEFRTSYVIGAQYIKTPKGNRPLVVTTQKAGNVDFLSIFSSVISSGVSSDRFEKIYGIDIDKPLIKTRAFQSVLSPLLVAHFITIMKPLVSKGLKKDYIQKSNNLSKVKGKIKILVNERKNIIFKRFDRVYCSYQDYSADIPENRLLKRALLFCERMLKVCSNSKSQLEMSRQIKILLNSFEGVSDLVSTSQVNSNKGNKLYKDYYDAVRVSKLILKRYDNNISRAGNNEDNVPTFWINMPLLYELYVLGLLRKAFGNDIVYQFNAKSGVPDFLDIRRKLILDTKYKRPDDSADIDIIRQLSGYARNKLILQKILGNESDIRKIVPCIFIYPYGKGQDGLIESIDSFSGWELSRNNIQAEEIPDYLDLYKVYARLPVYDDFLQDVGVKVV